MKKTEISRSLQTAAESCYLANIGYGDYPVFSCQVIEDIGLTADPYLTERYRKFAGIDFDLPFEKFKDWYYLTDEERGTARSLCILMFRESLKKPVKGAVSR